ncbi:MAG: nucleotidyltransferase domain-containing protein [Bacillota bacterium]|nr:nucleotidyltransferase domain-containing protein [Bacillota bacterium]
MVGLSCIDLEARTEIRRRELERELRRIVSRCRELGYRKVILFGSLARGEVGPWSDIDLILVRDTDKRFLDRLDEFYRQVLPKTAVDVLIYTPEEFAELFRSRRFVQQAVLEGVVLVDQEGVAGGGGEVAEAGGAQP